MWKLFVGGGVLFMLGVFCPQHYASAHEVYVLTASQFQEGMATVPFDGVAVAWSRLTEFLFWGLVTAFTILVIFFASVSHSVEQMFDPMLRKGRRYAAPIARITVGISFIAAAYYGASYGPELPFFAAYGAYTDAIRILLAVVGTLIVIGQYVRLSALISLVLFSYAVSRNGTYMLTYMSYVGELAALFILGAHHGAYPRTPHRVAKERRHLLGLAAIVEPVAKFFAPYSFMFLRICFGISLFYASFYAKILHNDLALQVATVPLAGHQFSIAHYLGFEPHFLVLGAAIVEIVIAVFFMLGIEIRFTSLFVLFWLALSLGYFGETVWPHIILIGIPIAFICYGYDKYSLEGYFFKRGAREPVL